MARSLKRSQKRVELVGIYASGASLRELHASYAHFSASTTGPDIGSVTPSPLPRSSSVSRNVSSVAIMFGREAASASMSVHSAIMQ
jgi:hypothetical protein